MIPTNKKVPSICQCGVGSKRDAVNSESHHVWLNTSIQHQDTYRQDTEVRGPAEHNHVIVSLEVRKIKKPHLNTCPLFYQVSGFFNHDMVYLSCCRFLSRVCMLHTCTNWFPLQHNLKHGSYKLLKFPCCRLLQYSLTPSHLIYIRLFQIPYISKLDLFTLDLSFSDFISTPTISTFFVSPESLKTQGRTISGTWKAG